MNRLFRTSRKLVRTQNNPETKHKTGKRVRFAMQALMRRHWGIADSRRGVQSSFFNLQSSALSLVLRPISRFALFALIALSLTVAAIYPYTRSPHVSAAANSTINFQARILTATGAVVPDGAYNVEFKIYDSAAAGTSAQGVCSLDSSTDDCWWLESRTGASQVTTKNGYITVALGDTTTGGTAFGANVPWDQELWLSMRIGGTGAPSWDAEMSPRMKVTAVPYAMTAQSAQTLKVTNGANSTTVSVDTPTGTRTINLPDASGTIAVSASGNIALNATTGSLTLTGQVPIANGGTGASTAQAAINALSGLTTDGDLLYFNGTNSTRLARGNDGDCLLSSTTSILWGTCTGSGSGVSIVGTIDGGSYSANGASISGNTIYLQTASNTQVGLVNTSAQTFAGTKTFNGGLVVAASQSLALTGGNTASRPGSPTEGMVYYDSQTHQLLQYNNTKWVSDKTDAVIVAASNSSQADKDAADYVADGNTAAANDGDQVQINAALTAASGKKVALLAGTYTLDASISVPNNTILSGVGMGTIITIPNTLNVAFSAIVNTDTTTGTNVTIRDLKLEGNNSNQGGSVTMVGIKLTGMGGGSVATARAGATIIGIESNNWYDSGSGNCRGAGICLVSSKYNNISSSTFKGNEFYAISLDASASNTISAVTIQGEDTVGSGVYLTGSTNNVLTNSTILDNERGIDLDSSTGNTITGNTVMGDSGQTGIRLIGSTSNTVKGNNILNNGHGVFNVSSSNYNIFSGNTVQGNTLDGIYINGADGNSVSGNKLHDNGTSLNNDAVYVLAGSYNAITGNDITDTSCSSACYAIELGAGADYTYVAANHLYGPSAAEPATVSDSSATTVYSTQIVGPTYTLQNSSSAFEAQASYTISGTGAANNTTTLTGTSTRFNRELQVGDRITVNSQTRTITAIASSTSLTVDTAFTGGSWSGRAITRLPAILVARNSADVAKVAIDDVGAINQTFTTAVSDSAQSLSITHTNNNVGLAVQGVDLTPNLSGTPSSGTNTLNVINFNAGVTATAANRVTNGINFVSATGYTNFINTPTAVLSGAGALSGLTALSSEGTITFSGLNTAGIVQTNASGVLSTGSLDRNSGTFFSNALSGANGGTGQSTTSAGDILVGNASNGWNKLAIGGASTCLSSNGTAVSWGSCGTSTTLQGAYDADADGSDATIALSAADGSVIFQNPASGGTSSSYVVKIDQLNTGSVDGLLINSAGTGKLLRLQKSGVDAFSIASASGTTDIDLSRGGGDSTINFYNSQTDGVNLTVEGTIQGTKFYSTATDFRFNNGVQNIYTSPTSGTLAWDVSRSGGDATISIANSQTDGVNLTVEGTISSDRSLYTGVSSTTSGAVVFRQSASGNVLSLQAPSSALASNLSLTLPSTVGNANECLMNTSTAGILQFGTCSSGTPTLQGAYTAGSAGDQVIQLSSANDSVIFRNPSSSGTDSAYVLKVEQLNTGSGIDSLVVSNSGTGNILTLQNGSTTVLGVTSNGNLVANGASTATTGTTEATARTNVTTVTLTAAGSFANNDVIFINNAGQDYYTRIVSGGGTTTLTVSPAVSYDVSASVTKYTVQNIGATSTDYTTQSNRFFQGYFLGGVVTGAGSTTLSDGNLTSSNALKLQTASGVTVQATADVASALQVKNVANTNVLTVDTQNSLVSVGVPVDSYTNTFVVNDNFTSNAPTGTLLDSATYSAGNYVELNSTSSTRGEVEYTSTLGSTFTAAFDFYTSGVADAVYFYAYNTSTPTTETSASGGYIVLYDELVNQIQLRFNGSMLASASATNLNNATWHTTKIVRNGLNFKVYYDNVLVINYTDESRTLTGTKSGLGARSGASAATHRVRNYSVLTSALSKATFGVNNTTTNGSTFELQKSGTTLMNVNAYGAATFKNSINTEAAFQIQNSSGSSLFTADTANAQLIAGVDIVASASATATTGTTEATARTNVTTVTLTAAGSFANNDIIFINNAGIDYYTRIVSGGGTTTLTVSPAVSYDASASVTKYQMQSIGAQASNTGSANRFFQGYFEGGIVVGEGSTTYSDGLISSNQGVAIRNTNNTTTAFQVQKASGASVMAVDAASSKLTVYGSLISQNTMGGNILNVDSPTALLTVGGVAAGQYYINDDLSATVPNGTLLNSATYSAGSYVQLNSASDTNGQVEYTPTVLTDFDATYQFYSTGNADAQYFYAYNTSTPTIETASSGGYIVTFNEWSHFISLAYNGSTLSSVGASGFNDGLWHNVEIIKTGTNFKVYLDGVLKIDYTDSTRTLTGTKWGLGARSGMLSGTHRVKNFSVPNPLSGTGGVMIVNSATGTTKFQNSLNSTTALQIQNTSGVNILNIDTTNGELEVGSYNGGTNPVAGKIVVANTASANAVAVISGSQTGNYTVSIGTLTGNATMCTTDSVCTGYAPSATNGYVQFAPAAAQADTTTNSSIFMDKQNATGNLMQLQRGGTDAFVVTNSGGLLLGGGTGYGFTVNNKSVGITGSTANNAVFVMGGTTTNAGANLWILQDSGKFDLSSATATVSNVYGADYAANIQVASGTYDVTNAYGARYALNNTAGETINTRIAVGATFGTNNGTISNDYAIKVSEGATSGITNKYGIYIDPISGGSSSNYPLYVKSSGTGALLSIDNTGATTLRGSANSATAFRVQNTAGTSMLTVDTSASKVLVGGAIDTTTATTLSIGTSTATAITLGANTALSNDKSLTIGYGSTGSATALQVNANGTNLFTVDNTSTNRVTIGATGGCAGGAATQGRLCVYGPLSNSSGSAASGTNQNNTLRVTSTTAGSVSTAYGSYIRVYDDSTSTEANTLNALFVDTLTGTTNNNATSNGITVNSRSANAGNLLRLQSDSANVLTVSNTGAILTKNQANSATAFRVQNANGVNILNIDTTNGELEVGNYNGGTNPVNGALVLNNSSNANTVSIVSGATSSSYTLTLPTALGASGDCLKDTTGAGVLGFGTCGSSAPTLQGAYSAGSAGDQVIALSTANDSLIFRNPASGGTDSTYVLTLDQLATGARGGLSIQSAGTGNLLLVTDTTATAMDVFSVADEGAVLFKNRTNSTSGFQIQRSNSTTPVFNVDTTNNRIGIGTATPTAKLMLNNGGMLITGGVTTDDPKLYVTGTITHTDISQISFQNSPTFEPQAAITGALSGLYALENTVKIGNSSFNVTDAAGAVSQVITNNDYTGTLSQGAAFRAYKPTVIGTNKIQDSIGFYAYMPGSGATENSGNGAATTISNYGLKVKGDAAATSGGTLYNYAAYLELSSGNTAGTNNYGLYLTGNGGASATSNYAIYSASTASSYLAGNLGVGTTPSYRLDVSDSQASNYVARIQNTNTANTADGLLINLGIANASRTTGNYFVGFAGAGTVAGKIEGGASAVAYTTAGADYAEYFRAPTSDMPQAGELVMMDSVVDKGVERARASTYLPLAGVVSSNPGFIGNGPLCNVDDKNCDANYATYNALVALSGQVLAKVNTSNGAIARGDPITVSSVAGEGAKAVDSGYIVGYAMEPFAGGSGTIMVLIRPQFYTMNVAQSLQGNGMNITGNAVITGDMSIGGALNVSGQTNLTSLTVTGNAQFSGNLTVQNISVANITINGHIITAGNTPTAAVGSAAGTEDTQNNIAAPTATIEGNDTAGTITVVAGASTANGVLVEVMFNAPFGKSPKIILNAGNEETSNLKFYRDAENDKFRIKLPQAPTAGQTYTFDYFVVE